MVDLKKRRQNFTRLKDRLALDELLAHVGVPVSADLPTVLAYLLPVGVLAQHLGLFSARQRLCGWVSRGTGPDPEVEPIATSAREGDALDFVSRLPHEPVGDSCLFEDRREKALELFAPKLRDRTLRAEIQRREDV